MVKLVYDGGNPAQRIRYKALQELRDLSGCRLEWFDFTVEQGSGGGCIYARVAVS